MFQRKSIWNDYLKKNSLDEKYEKHRKIFLELFEKEWSKLFANSHYELCQINTGNRLRPQIALMGYLANEEEYSPAKLNFIVNVGISIELIHKSSLLIDDLIDNDQLRHNKPTFHNINGRDKTILFSLNLMSKAIIILKDTLLINKVEDIVFQKCIGISIQTLHDMSLGALYEVSLTKKELYSPNFIRKIISLETSTLIRNSLLIGYYSGNRLNSNIEGLLIEIGNSCGYIFQVMNDLEPFCNSKKNRLHKGVVNSDYKDYKKNIAIAFLFEAMSKQKKEKIIFTNGSIGSCSLEDISAYLEQYNITQQLVKEIEEIELKIFSFINECKDNGLSEQWCYNFKRFILLLIKVAKKRLQ